MKPVKLFSAIALAAATLTAQAGNLLVEGFDNVSALASAGWVFAPTTSSAGSGWMQGNPAAFPASSGAANAYLAANYVDSVATISDWVYTPVLALADGVTVNFDLHLLGDGYLDTVEVYAKIGRAHV